MNILLYKGTYQYNVINEFINNCINILKNKNCNVIVIDEKLEQENTFNKIVETFSNILIDVVIDFGAVGSHIKFNNECIYNITNSTYLAIFVDHPAYHIGKLSENIKNYLCCFNDKQHVEYINSLLPNHHKIAFFLPHGGLAGSNKEKKQNSTFSEYKKQKSIDIVFAGTFLNNIEKPWQNNLDYPSKLIDEVFELFMYDNYLSVQESFKIIFEKNKIRFSEIGKIQLANLYKLFQDYIRPYSRILLIKELSQSGLNITICGDGWSVFAKKYKNINYIGTLDIKDNLELIRKAKVLINVTPTLRNGSHERVFTGMLNNTVVFSDKSRYYDDFFEDEKSILYYSFNSLDKDIEKLKTILSDDKKLFEISQNAYEIANKYHTWENRVDTILDMVKLSKLMDK